MGLSAYRYRLTVVGLFVAFLGGVAASYDVAVLDQESTTPVAFNATGAPTVEFNLPDMMCEDGCAWTVNDILSKQPGAKDVRVDFEAKTATIAFEAGTFDSQSALAELVDKGFDNSTLKNQEPEASAKQPVSPSVSTEPTGNAAN
jgi:copper chaperone CopZ